MRRGKRPGGPSPQPGRGTSEPRESASGEPISEAANNDEAAGLRGFDLGLVPASVTPPKSSRHAAWFVIATSVLAFFGLATTAQVLVSRPSATEVADAPPFPRGNFGTAAKEDHRADSLLREEGTPSRGENTAESSDHPTGTDASAHAHDAHPRGTVAPPRAAGSPDGLARPDFTPHPTPPPTETPDPIPPPDEAPPRPVSVLASVTQRAETYLSHLCSGETSAAFELTAGELRERGHAAFVEHHPPTSCEVAAIEVGAVTAIATLHVPQPDGSTRTKQRELSFSAGSPAAVTSDVPVR